MLVFALSLVTEPLEVLFLVLDQVFHVLELVYEVSLDQLVRLEFVLVFSQLGTLLVHLELL